jgi:hypothetical protein
MAWPSGCGSDARAITAYVARDSAGVHIVENYAGTWKPDEAWRLSERPLLSLGMLDGPEPYIFSNIAGVRRLQDGRLVVANGGSAEIRFFTAGGAFLHSVGRQGGGPGEFREFTLFQSLPGDTLLVYDVDLQRLSYVAPPEGRIESVPFPIVQPGLIPGAGEETSPGVTSFPMLVGRLSDGSLLIAVTAGLGRVSDGVHVYPMPFYRFDPDTSGATLLAEYPGYTRFVFSEGGWTTMTGLQFAPGPHYHVHPSGFVYGHSSRYEVFFHTRTGELQRIVRRSIDPRPVTAADVEGAVLENTGDVTEAARTSRMGRMYAAMPVPEFHPFFHALLTDDAGRLWVRESNETHRSTWAVYENDGRLLGSIQMPRRFRPTQVTDEHVIGIAWDEMRVEYVQVFRLLRE